VRIIFKLWFGEISPEFGEFLDCFQMPAGFH
jgi:hypothetical protein